MDAVFLLNYLLAVKDAAISSLKMKPQKRFLLDARALDFEV